MLGKSGLSKLDREMIAVVVSSVNKCFYLSTLGMKEGEAIVHPWVNKSLEKAQAKVEGRNFFPSTLMVSPAPFENVSVVIIAAAAAGKLSSRKEFFKTGIAFISLSTGSGSPITPVDDVRMLLSGKPSEPDKAFTSFLTDRS